MRTPLSVAALLLTTPLAAAETATTRLDLGKVFQAAPIIYCVLFGLSVLAAVIWIYSLVTLRKKEMAPDEFLTNVRSLLHEQNFEAAANICEQEKNFCAPILHSGIAARRHGPQLMMDAMQAEGRRSGSALWQRISLLGDIAVVAPMLGLLGTVLGLFFAFYETDRSAETINGIFDGLGIAIGTTVAGLIVAILATVFCSSLKFRLVNLLGTIENEVLSMVGVIDLETTP
jgi:biopolymer transport protein ExbB